MDLKNPRQNSANFSHNNDCADVSTQKNVKNKRFLKIFGAGTLAIMMGIGTLCGVLISPMNSAQANASANATTESTLTPEEKLTAGVGLGLDPENDPVVWTTESGIEIRYGGASTVSTTALKGYNYITMGSYGGKAINWVIIGKSTSFPANAQYSVFARQVGIVSPNDDAAFANNNPAGAAIWNDNTQKDPILGASLSVYSATVSNKEIPSNCLLLLTEKNVQTANYYDKGNNGIGSNSYAGHTMATAMDAYCNGSTSSIGLNADQISRVQQVTLTNSVASYNINTRIFSEGSNTLTTRVFPLAYGASNSTYTQSFRIETYLGSGASKRISYNASSGAAEGWWTRSPNCTGSGSAYYVSSSGAFTSSSLNVGYGYRPAMVFKIAD